MSVRGVFAVDRAVWEHPVFADEPFSEREAFLWLVGEAAYKPRRARVGKLLVDLERGQVCHSLRFMAEKWSWSEARVRRYLARLAKDKMLSVKTDAGATQLTICNYDRYQRVSLPSDAAPTQERRRVEDIEDNKPVGGDDRVQRSREIISKCQEAAGEAMHPTGAAAMGVISDVNGWLDAGANLDDDVVPAIRAAAAKMRPGTLHSFAIARDRVAESVERRKRGLPPVDLTNARAPPGRSSNSARALRALDEEIPDEPVRSQPFLRIAN